MERFVRGEIVILEFPFSNLIEVKRRPALIIKVPNGDDVIVCQITGKPYEKLVEILIKKENFISGSLKVDSYLRIDKIFSVEKSLIKYKIGMLRKEKFLEIFEKVCEYLRDNIN